MANKDRENQEVNIIGPSTFIEGTIRSQGNIRVDGRIQGTVNASGNFIIGPTGEIEGDVEAKNITISGKFKGNIVSNEKLILESHSRVNGDINTKRLVVDDGASFSGHCKMDSSEESQ